jgi:hypothetical protein
MQGFESKAETTVRRRPRTGMGMAIAALVLSLTSVAGATDHYPSVPNRVHKKDHQVLDALARMTYAEPWEFELAGECNCFEPTCNNGGFMLSCGGEIEPPYAGLLFAVRRTSRETCLVCGCADLATLRATPICLGF